MSVLNRVEKTKRKRPYFICLYGPSGLGKSTFGSEAPSPIFLDIEDGLSRIDTDAIKPKDFKDLLSIVDSLIAGDHKYKTLVIDTLDHLEKLVFAEVCKQQEKSNIEDISYKRGYIFAVDEWVKLTDKLSVLREKMNVILLAHAVAKNEKNPMGEDYMKYTMKFHDKAAALITEKVDALLFATYEVFTKKEGSKVKAIGDGARVVHTESRPGFHAKNRYNLPETLPLGWNDFIQAAESNGSEDETKIDEAITRKLENFKDEELTQKVNQTRKGADIVKKKKILEKLTIKEEGMNA
jgi:hypothetical protein